MSKDTKDKIYFITGGGTGGHIYPAVAVINELMREFGVKNENIFYIGNKKNLEAAIAKDNGFQFLSTTVTGMPRKLSKELFKWFFNLITSTVKALYYVIKYKPDVVFATGGYVCAPVLFASQFLNIPYVLHDSDCYPGIVTRNFASQANGVNLAFEDAKQYIKKGILYFYNNPVREAFFKKKKDEARKELNIKDEFLILVMGGSQGAKSINEAAIDLINNFKNRDDVKIIVQTGKKNYEDFIKNLEIPNNVRIEPYFDDMSTPILASNLIVSRAGSISISEILSAKTPSVLVPYPYAASDHQRINAKSIVAKNAALYIEDKDIKEQLTKTVQELLYDKDKYEELKYNAALLGENYKNSTRKITELIIASSRN